MGIHELFIQSLYIDWERIEAGSYLRRIGALSAISVLEFSEAITFFAGENGSGKSSLLEAIAIASGFNPEGGTRNYSFKSYDSHSALHTALRLTRSFRKPRWGYFLRAESFYNVATQEMEYADEKHPSARYHEKSHGESFLLLAQNQFRPGGLYLLDEPEAALSPQRQLSLLLQIHACAQQGAQFIIASHSPLLLGIPGASILHFDEDAIRPCAYEDTESYRITKLFIQDRARLLHSLLADDAEQADSL